MKKIVCVLTLFFLINLASAEFRKAAFAGRWYPKSSKKLRSMLRDFFENIDLSEEGKVAPFAIIAPHAGYMYSGQVAAYGFSLLKNQKYDTVFLLGSSHNALIDKISVYNGDYYRTPLGKVEIDKKISRKILNKSADFAYIPELHNKEHSLEAELPFLQYQLDEFKIVPILTSKKKKKILSKMADSLIEIVEKTNKKTLFVLSTDMSHYHDYDSAVEIDNQTIKLILEKKWELLEKKLQNKECELCGQSALHILAKVITEVNNTRPILLKYANSGDVTNNKESKRVVGYSSIVIPKKNNKKIKGGHKMSLNDENKKYLLNLARKSIKTYLEKNEKYQPEKPEDDFLKKERAVFVTLNQKGNLRGCIGHMHARMPLYRAVSEMAVSAAFQDFRFSPVKKPELDKINIEISVLSPMQKLDDYKKIRLGTDGVWIKKGMASGVFLPQVATETGWDLDTFLGNLCSHKAGLPRNAYKNDDVEIYIFQVDKFSEKDF